MSVFLKKSNALLLCFLLLFSFASCGKDESLTTQIASTAEPATQVSATQAQTQPQTTQAESTNKIKNVIYFIGDGMGFNSIEKTKAETGASLAMDTFKVKACAHTYSNDSAVTDSAAGATALACAVKTNNGFVGVYPDDATAKNSFPMNLSELFASLGKKTGIITTDSTDGATPAGFSAHTSSRKNSEDITECQLKSSLDLIWGKKSETCTREKAEQNGFAYAESTEDFEALTAQTKSFAQFEGEIYSSDGAIVPTFLQMTQKAIEFLSTGENGFFLMAEGAHIDKNSHDNNGEEMKKALLSFDEAIEAALDFAKRDGQTLVVVTADHETGGITPNGGKYVYTTGSHTGVDVPLFVFGSDDFLKNGETAVDNTEIPKRIASVCGIDSSLFPKRISS